MSTHPNYPKYTCTHTHLSPPNHNKCISILAYPKYISIYTHPHSLIQKKYPPTSIHPRITPPATTHPWATSTHTKFTLSWVHRHFKTMLPPTPTHSDPLSFTRTHSHSLLTTATNPHPLVSTLINSNPLSSTPIHSHTISSTPIHSHLHPLSFNALALVLSHSHQLRAYVQPLSSMSSPYPNTLTQSNSSLTIQTHI